MAKLHFPYPGPRQTEQAAFAYVEAHLWANGRVCPHCGVVGESSAVKGKTTRAGLYKCYACRKPFTLRMGTIFEGSHLPLHLWLHVIHLMCASKKGISTRQIQRVLNCSMKTAWFLTHRIREVMAPNAGEPPLGGRGKIRSQRILEATKMTAQNVVRANVHPESILHTDGSQIYREIGATKKHEFVDHSVSYVGIGPAGRKVHTNTLEGFFSVFKRGMVGVYQHCGEQHLDRYLAEFDFRANNREKFGIDDVSRADITLKASKGKRLTYRTTVGA